MKTPKAILLSFVFVILLCGNAISEVYDSFDSGISNDLWIISQDPSTISANSGSVLFQTIQSHINTVLYGRGKLTGDFIIEMDFSNYSAPVVPQVSGGPAQIALALFTDAGKSYQLGRETRIDGAERMFVSDYVSSPSSYEYTETTSISGIVKFIRSNNHLSGYIYQNGNWTEITSSTIESEDDLRFAIMFSNNVGLSGTFQAKIDELRISGDTLQTASAFQISDIDIQHYLMEGTDRTVKAGFWFTNFDNGMIWTNTSPTVSVTCPNGTEYTSTEVEPGPISRKRLQGEYDNSTGYIYWQNRAIGEVDYAIYMPPDDSGGDFYFEISLPDGSQYTRIASLPKPIELVPISSESFTIELINNKIVWNWILPDQGYDLNSTYLRLIIVLYRNGAATGNAIDVKYIPSNFTKFEISEGMTDWMQMISTEFSCRIYVRTNDNNNSARSKTRTFRLTPDGIVPSSRPLIGDVDYDGQIGLGEAINALQITSGKRP